MASILVLNNYSISKSWSAALSGKSPDHFLYGINYLQEKGHRVVVVDDSAAPGLRLLQDCIAGLRLPIPVGDLSQQWRAIQALYRFDVIYSPCFSTIFLFNYLRALGVLTTPVVCLAHHPLMRERMTWLRRPLVRLAVRGTDAFPSLSRAVAEEINSLALCKASAVSVNWGPDLAFYPKQVPVGRGVVAAGRTGRDFETFGAAASQSTSPALIICPQDAVTPRFQSFGKHVLVLANVNPIHYGYRQLVEYYASARVLAVPMHTGPSLCGLTSLVDALGMGKPVIMTRHPLIDIDIESEGIGRWVAPYDLDGWRDAIQFFEDHPDEASEMGRRARRLAEAGHNSKSFGDQIRQIIEKVLAK
jgi:glycosyltransferase involved in cell wall biosynthesis